MAEGLCRTRPDVASLRSRLNVCLSARTTPTVSWRGNTGPRPAKFLGALENTAPQISCTLSLARFRERQALDTHVLSSVVRTLAPALLQAPPEQGRWHQILTPDRGCRCRQR
jgi:hypothetical protein